MIVLVLTQDTFIVCVSGGFNILSTSSNNLLKLVKSKNLSNVFKISAKTSKEGAPIIIIIPPTVAEFENIGRPDR